MVEALIRINDSYAPATTDAEIVQPRSKEETLSLFGARAQVSELRLYEIGHDLGRWDCVIDDNT